MRNESMKSQRINAAVVSLNAVPYEKVDMLKKIGNLDSCN